MHKTVINNKSKRITSVHNDVHMSEVFGNMLSGKPPCVRDMTFKERRQAREARHQGIATDREIAAFLRNDPVMRVLTYAILGPSAARMSDHLNPFMGDIEPYGCEPICNHCGTYFTAEKK